MSKNTFWVIAGGAASARALQAFDPPIKSDTLRARVDARPGSVYIADFAGLCSIAYSRTKPVPFARDPNAWSYVPGSTALSAAMPAPTAKAAWRLLLEALPASLLADAWVRTVARLPTLGRAASTGCVAREALKARQREEAADSIPVNLEISKGKCSPSMPRHASDCPFVLHDEEYRTDSRPSACQSCNTTAVAAQVHAASYCDVLI